MKNFKEDFLEILANEFSTSLEESSIHEQYIAVGSWVKKQYSKNWIETNKDYTEN